MHCPFCRHDGSRVVDSRTAEDGTSIRRRRECQQCGRRFTTLETASLSVRKRSGVVEPFSRDKVMVGVRRACQGRPVSDDQLALLAHKVEEAIRAGGQALGLEQAGFDHVADHRREDQRLQAGGQRLPGPGRPGSWPADRQGPGRPARRARGAGTGGRGVSSLIARKRADFHHRLIESGTLAISPSGVASNADRSQQFSQRVALAVARALGAQPDRVVLPDHSPTELYSVVTARPRRTAWSQRGRRSRSARPCRTARV